ncbi:hypothetical protein GCM10009676_23410 [Prauserella halophila]|uniref:DUF4244 domain-containing protein n=1 Tax=Prauserella halophila TaxID=185641 RepID=A0ABP4GU05_9PSEU|nr:DUF4244 domain-containing protein [Prauserella halophila]MCP2235471.1 Protein of unknown function (DUF4244) [Prauserella halophila]
MNTVTRMVRTVEPVTGPVNMVLPMDSETGVPMAAMPARGGVPQATARSRGVAQGEPEVDLAALLPRQAGTERERVPCTGTADGEYRRRRHGEGDPGDRPGVAADRGEADDTFTDVDGDAGMSTAEYAIGTLAAAALAAVLYMIVTGDSVASALTSVIEQALSVDF